ncbi:MAG: helix-hairpin-helix domain-containing protein [Candidatus Omnitrophota bacterium]
MKKRQEGIILIFVLMVLTTFSLLGMGLAYRVRIENKLAGYFAANEEIVYLAKSKLNRIMPLIARDSNDYDSFEEDWSLREEVDLDGGGSLKILVEDEDGKLDINNVTEAWLSNIDFVSQSLRDEILEKRPFFVKEEMLSLENIKNRNLVLDEPDILDLVTVQKHDKININTIREAVLKSVPGLSESAVDAILSLRRNQPIEDMETLKDTGGISLNELQILNKFLKTTSSFYTVKIRIEDGKNKIAKSFRVVLKKDVEAKSVEIIRWLEQ